LFFDDLFVLTILKHLFSIGFMHEDYFCQMLLKKA